MTQFLEAISAGWIGTVLGVLGIILGYLLYRRSRVGGFLGYQTRGDHLIGFSESSLPEDVTVFYRGQQVPRITSSEVALWNAGLASLRGSDIATRDPLALRLAPHDRIPSYSVVRVTREVCGVEVTQNSPNELRFAFEFLDVDDGLRVAILHTGSERHLTVSGTLTSSHDGVRDLGIILDSSRLRRRRPDVPLPMVEVAAWVYGGRPPRVVTLAIASGLLMLGYAFWSNPGLRSWPPSLKTVKTVFALMGLLYVGMGALVWTTVRHRFPRSLDTEPASHEAVADSEAQAQESRAIL